jgi:signal transduction histidine kinase
VRSVQGRPSSTFLLRRQTERLVGLPFRPASVRLVLDASTELDETEVEPADPSKTQAVTELDPGWVLDRLAAGAASDPLETIAERPWWPNLGAEAGEALTHLWRHAVAASQAARRLARDAGDASPDRVGRAALLHGLARWAVAAVDPAWLAAWMAEPDAARRLELERHSLGCELTSLGRNLAERWRCDPLVVDAAWLHGDLDTALAGCASDPQRLGLVQEAYAWAERTPWALGGSAVRGPSTSDPRLRLLVAEVQVRCGVPFVDPDSTPQEERLARSNARLRIQLGQLRAVHRSQQRFIEALIGSEPGETPETWAERAGLSLCGERGVTAARVVWTAGAPSAESGGPAPADPARGERAASLVRPLLDGNGPCAEVHLWGAEGGELVPPAVDASWGAWQAWARLVAERARLADRLETIVRVHRERVATEEPRLRQAKLEALAEFAAGAGHELNNPLAVIVGRAQLVLVRETDPGAVRSLRTILTQAQRAHRILRDLMYVARPPELRLRFCQLEEVLRNSLRDARDSADERGVRLLAEPRQAETRVWADPEALRHLTDILLRNALEATPKGGTVRVTLTAAAEAVSWMVEDNGRGLNAIEAMHLFDPFYCGRQAGRGLGLGLSRAARIVSQAGGEIRWHTTPGQGTTFHVHLPLTGPPRVPAELAGAPPVQPRDDQPLLRS